MKPLSTAVKIIARIIEISHWVATVLMAGVAVCSLTAPQFLGHLMDIDTLKTEGTLTVYGFEATLTNPAGQINTTALFLFAIGAVVIFALVAMSFRNIYLIVKKSETATPFQPDNIRMLREIGIFSIAIPVVGLIMSVILRLAVGINAIETSVHLSGFFTGLIALWLTQFFTYGAQLESDVNGLV